MKITSLDDSQKLWSVEELLSPEEVEKILAIDWPSLPWQRQEGQENWHRRRIESECAEIQEVNRTIFSKLSDINSTLGTTYQNFYGM